MTVSIIIPNYNQGKYLEKTLDALKNQVPTKGIRNEIIVIDNESTDQSIEIAKNFGCTVLVNRGEKNPYVSRNMAVEYSNAEFLAFLDAKSIPANDWLYKGMNHLTKNGDQIIVGKINIRSMPNPSYEELAYKIIYLDNRYSQFKNGTFPAQNFFLSKKLFNQIGPFNTFRSGSDNEWFDRARSLQISIYFNPNIVVESFAKTKEEFYTDVKRMGVGARENWKATKGKFKTNLIAFSYLFPMWISTFNQKVRRRKLNLSTVKKTGVWLTVWKARILFALKMLGF